MSEKTERYLAWDTSTITGVIAAFEITGNVLREVVSWSLSLETSRHSERLLWSIDTVLQSAGWELESLSGIAVGVGPGSFTGIRIGVATARILSRSLSIPIIPLSSLAILSRGAIESLRLIKEWDSKEKKSVDSILVVACTDATKGEWITLMGQAKAVRECITFSEGDLPGIWGRSVVEAVFTPEVLFEQIKNQLKKMGEGAQYLALGQSVLRYPELWDALPKKSKVELESTELHHVQVSSLIRVSFEAIQQGLKRESSQLRPRYLRASEAEVKLSKGLLKVNLTSHRGGVA